MGNSPQKTCSNCDLRTTTLLVVYGLDVGRTSGGGSTGIMQNGQRALNLRGNEMKITRGLLKKSRPGMAPWWRTREFLMSWGGGGWGGGRVGSDLGAAVSFQAALCPVT